MISNYKAVLSFGLIFLFFGGQSFAQHSLPDTIHAFLIHQPIKLDGRLNEPAWQKARKISNFTQRELHEGKPATERTEVAVLYDTKNIYVGVWCYDNHPDKIIASQMQRDFNYGTDDNFQIMIDPYNDKRNGYLFVTNPNAARADIMISQNGQSNNESWNGVWNVKTTRTASGWFAEFEIPFSTLRFSKNNTQIWGINFERNIPRKREQDDWQGWSRNSSIRQVSNAGFLTGIKGVSKTSLIELKPYGITGVQKDEGEKGAFKWNIGGDVNYLITPTLKMNLTINTDFAQVESDQMQVNLSRFSVYYPEKREFFLEGKNYFNFDLGSVQPFYSRRIGLAPNGAIVPIIAGVRVMGKTGKTSIGAMSIETARKDTLPPANYSVVRVKQDVFKESSVGMIAVSKLEPGHQNFVYGADFNYFNSHFKGNKNISFGGSVAQSYTSDRKQKTGLASRLFFDYPNDFIQFSTVWDRSDAGFNPEVGFQRRSAYQMYNADLRIKPRPKKHLRFIQQFVFKLFDFNYYQDIETHKLQSFWSEFRPLGFTTRSGEFFEFNIQRKAENLTEDFNIYDDIIVPQGEYWFTDWELQVGTYRGRKVYGFAYTNWGGFYNGRRTLYAGMINWQISKYLRFSARYSHQNVFLPGGNFVVHEISSHIDFAVNPNLFGSVFAQWNNQAEEMLMNFRVNWIPKPGTNLYFVVNQGYDTENHRFDTKYTTVQIKLIWRFVM